MGRRYGLLGNECIKWRKHGSNTTESSDGALVELAAELKDHDQKGQRGRALSECDQPVASRVLKSLAWDLDGAELSAVREEARGVVGAFDQDGEGWSSSEKNGMEKVPGDVSVGGRHVTNVAQPDFHIAQGASPRRHR